MLTSVLSFTPEMAAITTEYCTKHSKDVSPKMNELWDWTVKEFDDADKMSSPLQGATMMFLAELLKPKRNKLLAKKLRQTGGSSLLTRAAGTVLEIGCYTGYSALAWHESTIKTQAKIITLELDPKMIAASRRTIDRYGLHDRVALIEGPAQETFKTLDGTFDIIFVDANKEGYEGYVKYILDAKLLSPQGLILCDNIFARGMTISTESNPTLPDKVRPYWTENGKALQKFNTNSKNDERIDVVLLPVYDGLTMIKWRDVTVN